MTIKKKALDKKSIDKVHPSDGESNNALWSIKCIRIHLSEISHLLIAPLRFAPHYGFRFVLLSQGLWTKSNKHFITKPLPNKKKHHKCFVTWVYRNFFRSFMQVMRHKTRAFDLTRSEYDWFIRIWFLIVCLTTLIKFKKDYWGVDQKPWSLKASSPLQGFIKFLLV